MLHDVSSHLDESMGIRKADSQPSFSPVPSQKDVGRIPHRKFGRLDLSRVAADPKQPRTEFDDDVNLANRQALKDQNYR